MIRIRTLVISGEVIKMYGETVFRYVLNGVIIYYLDGTKRFISNSWYDDIYDTTKPYKP